MRVSIKRPQAAPADAPASNAAPGTARPAKAS
jgi:hypothetical protein